MAAPRRELPQIVLLSDCLFDRPGSSPDLDRPDLHFGRTFVTLHVRAGLRPDVLLGVLEGSLGGVPGRPAERSAFAAVSTPEIGLRPP